MNEKEAGGRNVAECICKDTLMYSGIPADTVIKRQYAAYQTKQRKGMEITAMHI
jgi:hypothetical protein